MPVLAALCLLGLSLSGAARSDPVILSGPLTQGGMVIGRTEPDASVTLDGEPLRVAPDGRFVFGFNRDAAPEATLAIVHPDGTTETRTLAVVQRHYDVQRIDGLPPSKVTPPADLLARLARERAAVADARADTGDGMAWAAPLAWPAVGPVTGVYGSQRILNGEPRQPHYGVDIAAPEGSPVRAPAAGRVVLAEPAFYYEGGIVIIDHGYGVSSTLFHMQRVDVRAGESVSQGQPIGLLGAAGRASGPHVDWRMNWNGVRLDPALLMGPMPAK
ncbi:MAG: peptidoglycan DD-metalloendopeptidase family protein [Alphaproteobacteria bacterium]|nr:peptidoglycan DD-metalloendopeptidase family protein [Alphaproteobacteria bacterium]